MDPVQIKKTLTFLSRRSPYGQSNAKSCLDMVLSAAVFDQCVNYVFMDDGVWQLQRGQQTAGISARNLSAAFSALPLYGINEVYVDAASLTERGLAADELVVNVKVCDTTQIAALLRDSDLVFNL